MHRTHRTLLVSLATLGVAAALMAQPVMAKSGFAKGIEKAHGKSALQQQQAVQARLVVEFGGQTMIEGTLLSDTAGGKVRIDLDNGTQFVFDGSEAWTSPAASEVQGGRFHVLTWSYFLLAPFKLQDPGAHLEKLGKRPYEGEKTLDAAKLTFASGTGDSPDDWYVLYRNAQKQLQGMAYIVTFGKGLAEAEKEPHAITYHQPVEVDGVTFSSHWQFWNWTEADGIHGDPIGQVKLSDIRFVTPDASSFVAPKDSRPEPAPAP